METNFHYNDYVFSAANPQSFRSSDIAFFSQTNPNYPPWWNTRNLLSELSALKISQILTWNHVIENNRVVTLYKIHEMLSEVEYAPSMFHDSYHEAVLNKEAYAGVYTEYRPEYPTLDEAESFAREISKKIGSLIKTGIKDMIGMCPVDMFDKPLFDQGHRTSRMAYSTLLSEFMKPRDMQDQFSLQ